MHECVGMYVDICVLACIYECIHLGMYEASHTRACMFKYISMYECIYLCTYVCVHACIPRLHSHVTVQIFDMSENKYEYHSENTSHKASMLHWHVDATILHISATTLSTAVFTQQGIAMHAPTTNMPIQMLQAYHTCKLVLCTWNNCQYMCFIWTNCNQQCNQETGIHTFYNIGICPETNMPTTLCMYVPLQCYCSLHIDPSFLHMLCNNNKIHLLLTISLQYMC